MAKYDLQILKSAEKELTAIPVPHNYRIKEAIEALADNPRPAGCIKLSGFDHYYRIRVGQYRVVYEIRDRALLVIIGFIESRGAVYRKLKRH